MLECNVERVEGIEPSPTGWEPVVLPLNYTRMRMAGVWAVKPPNATWMYGVGTIFAQATI